MVAARNPVDGTERMRYMIDGTERLRYEILSTVGKVTVHNDLSGRCGVVVVAARTLADGAERFRYEIR